MLKKKRLLGVDITDTTEREVLEYILQNLEKSKEKFYIVTPNPEILVYANKNQEFKNILNQARIGLCDGIGVLWAGKVLGKSLKQKTTGTDFVQKLCKEVSEKPITVGFLGAGPAIAEETAECLQSRYPGLKVVFVAQEWGEDGFVPSIDILFVAFGFPKQEEWMNKNLSKIPVQIAIGVGGAFDYISGKIPRAPKWVQQIGFEWLYRLIRQPWRWKRQLTLAKFVYLVLREKFQ